jgi:hypothetical protein
MSHNIAVVKEEPGCKVMAPARITTCTQNLLLHEQRDVYVNERMVRALVLEVIENGI